MEKPLITASMCAPVDTHESSYLGVFLEASAGALREPSDRSTCACACIFFRSDFDVVLRNASFGCNGQPFFNLAWREHGFGFASAYLQVSVDV